MVVTRFAPSPTGRLQIGNLRAALLSWLTARKAGGTFILRIDDTDKERSKEEHVDAIKRDLEWLGLDWDRFERQSERFERYEAVAEEWRADGLLYAAYETQTELDLKRKRLLAMGKPPIYDRAALDLTDAQKAAFEAEGRRPAWRFKLDGARVGWTDQIRGETSVDLSSVSDPVLIRADGSWLYTPCSVVDDVDMGVTHVVRGEDHVTNTATQIQMIASIGGETPTFAHHSLIVGPDGDVLSKRHGSLSLEALRDAGFEPLSLVSMIARLGASDPIEARTDRQAVVDGFDISRFGRAPARFDHAELRRVNAQILAATPYDAVADRFSGSEPLWIAVRGNLDMLADADLWIGVTRDGPEAPLTAEDDRAFVTEALSMLPPRPWDGDTWRAWTAAVKTATGRKGKQLFMPLRHALTGRTRGPEMAELLPLMSEAAIARVRSALG